MQTAQILPYITSLGLLFVLIGFATLVWTRAASHRFPFVAVFCFALGLGLTGGSLYAQTYYEEMEMVSAPTPLSVANRAAIRACEDTAKSVYLAAIARAKISCPADSAGWPNSACVTQTDAGALLFQKLHTEENQCFEDNHQ